MKILPFVQPYLYKPFIKQTDNSSQISKTSNDIPFYGLLPNNILVKSLQNEELFTSKTMKKLFSPEFKPTRKFDDYYHPITTVINKETGKPQEVYVERILDGYQEEWNIYLSGKAIGSRNFFPNNFNSSIYSGYMESCDSRFAGIGIRCHQIAIERMLQENIRNLYISAMPHSFPFHYKCGFRIPEKTILVSNKQIKEILENWHQQSLIPIRQLEKTLVLRQNNGRTYCVISESEENFRKLAFLEGKTTPQMQTTTMILPDDKLEMWKKLIQSQPILLK